MLAPCVGFVLPGGSWVLVPCVGFASWGCSWVLILCREAVLECWFRVLVFCLIWFSPKVEVKKVSKWQSSGKQLWAFLKNVIFV